MTLTRRVGLGLYLLYALPSTSNDEPLQFTMLTEATFRDAFGELYLDDEIPSLYNEKWFKALYIRTLRY